MEQNLERCRYCGAWKHVDWFCRCPDGKREQQEAVARIARSMQKGRG